MVSGAAVAAARPKRRATARVARAADLRLGYGSAPGGRGARPGAPVPVVGHDNGARETAPVPARGATLGMQGNAAKPKGPCGRTNKGATSKLALQAGVKSVRRR